jgi:6,7-dimethyl-8-ribityllumazine synthase
MKGLETNVVSEKAKKASYGIVYTSWNTEIVQEILLETKKELTGQGVAENKIIIKEVPGAFELPLAAKLITEKNNVSCVISIGAIIKGDTPHFDFISQACIDGLQSIALETRIPMICGVLTTNNIEQARERSDSSRMNKGKEFALSAMNMVDTLA